MSDACHSGPLPYPPSCIPHTPQDLFYALRGAGQGAFGVVTEVVLRTHPKLKGVVAVTGRVNTQSQSAYREFVREWMKAHREFDHMGITGYNYLNQPSSLFVHLLPVKHNDEGDLEHWKGKMEEAFREPIEWIKKRDDMQLVDMNYSMQENFFEFYEKDFMEAFEGMDPVGVSWRVVVALYLALARLLVLSCLCSGQ